MKARAQKKMLKRVVKKHAAAASKTAHKIVHELTPSSRTKTNTLASFASGAASVASLLGGVWAVANSDVARDLLGEMKLFRRRNDFGRSAGSWIALGAGAAAVATGVAFFLGTQSGQRVRHQVATIAKPYFEKAKETANEVREEIAQKNSDGVTRSNSIS